VLALFGHVLWVRLILGAVVGAFRVFVRPLVQLLVRLGSRCCRFCTLYVQMLQVLYILCAGVVCFVHFRRSVVGYVYFRCRRCGYRW